MYNLTVDEAHTFFVGNGDWLVHNVCSELQAGLDILKGNPDFRGIDFYELIDNGSVIIHDLDALGVRAVGLTKMDAPDIFIGSSKTNPYDTAATIFEEIYHKFQRGGPPLPAEFEAAFAVREWANNHGLYDNLSKALRDEIEDPSLIADRYSSKPYGVGIFSNLYDQVRMNPPSG